MKTKHRLEESIALKTPPLNITYERIRVRSQRPEREMVHDEVRHRSEAHALPHLRTSASGVHESLSVRTCRRAVGT